MTSVDPPEPLAPTSAQSAPAGSTLSSTAGAHPGSTAGAHQGSTADSTPEPTQPRRSLRSRSSRPGPLGTIGTALVAVGSLGVGAITRTDPLLEAANLSWLRFGHGLVIAIILLWTGVGLTLIAWVRLGRALPDGQYSIRRLCTIGAAWTLPLLVAVPLFSRDAYSYLAQGALLRDGFDPYVVGPVANPGILLDNVSPVWIATTAPYGPAFLLLAEGVTAIFGDNMIAGTIALRILMLPGPILTVWGIVRICRHFGTNPATVVWLAVLNPLVLIHLVGGAHNEMLMVGLMIAGIALALDGRHSAAVLTITLGVAVKATAAIALPFIVWIWVAHLRERKDNRTATPLLFLRALAASLALFGAVFVAVSAAAGVGIGWVTALSGSAKIINWLSLPTILAHIVTVGTSWFADLNLEPVLDVTRLICGALLPVVMVWAWWRFRGSALDATRGILVCLVAVVVLSPATLPWYYSWPLALTACVPLSPRTLTVLVGLSTWLMVIFNPDGSHGLYSLPHVLVATALAILAARSLHHVDPLRLRQLVGSGSPRADDPRSDRQTVISGS